MSEKVLTLLERIQGTTAELDALLAKVKQLIDDSDRDDNDFEITEADAWAGAMFQFMFEARGKPPRMILHLASKLDMLTMMYMLDEVVGGVMKEHANCTADHCTVTGKAHEDWPEEIA